MACPQFSFALKLVSLPIQQLAPIKAAPLVIRVQRKACTALVMGQSLIHLKVVVLSRDLLLMRFQQSKLI
jgi:hypothetical protein